MKILQGKKWDQLNRRDEVLEYKTHKCKNAMFSFTKRECLRKTWHCTLLGFSCNTEKTSLNSCRTFATLFEMIQCQCVPIL